MANPTELSKSISHFATDLYSNVIEGKSSDVIISPFSVHIALSLTLMGARGNTANEIFIGLKLSGSRRHILQEFHQILKPLQNNPMLKIANKVFIKRKYDIKFEFHNIAEEQFYSETQMVNFAKKSQTAFAIDTWLVTETDDKIKNLIAVESLGADDRMVLINVIYFKGLWQHQFPKNRSFIGHFYSDYYNFHEVDMMRVKNRFFFREFEDLDAVAIELPYKDSDMSMLIILPNKINGLSLLESKLEDLDVSELKKRMYMTEVTVILPKFKIEFELSLVDTLKKMGMKEMFSYHANFSGLVETTEPFYITDVVHKAFIDVNEEGAEAAAATTAVIRTRMVRRRPRPFVADHPFYFAIISKNEGIIFCGRKLK